MSCVDYTGQQTIREMWLEGYSATMIAQRLYTDYPKVTRQVVIGLVSRARKAGHEWAALRITNTRDLNKRIQRVYAAPKPKIETQITIPNEPEFIGPLNDFPAPGYCKYPHGDPQKEYQMCGHPTIDTQYPWCSWHRDNIIYPNRQQKAA